MLGGAKVFGTSISVTGEGICGDRNIEEAAFAATALTLKLFGLMRNSSFIYSLKRHFTLTNVTISGAGRWRLLAYRSSFRVVRGTLIGGLLTMSLI